MNALIELTAVNKSFRSGDGSERNVLENLNFRLNEGEIVALLGKSGSGKSTLLRMIAGLIPASSGQVLYRGREIHAPVAGISMVFQSFALFPWLTVRQNVELGLEAQGMKSEEREQRCDEVLELIGLSGFGSALPRELSGGMKQRVGIARALVTNPDILLMDEAFSALDVLTGETLRDDMLKLWDEKRISTKGMLIVSHNIEEAVMMADRIIVLSSDPGQIRHDIAVRLPRPRAADSAAVRRLVDDVYALMTARAAAVVLPKPAALNTRLPDADVSRIEGLLAMLSDVPFNGRADLPHLAEESELSDEELFPTYEALGLLGLAHIEKGDIALSALGERYARAEQGEQQEIFGQQLLKNVPLVAHICHELGESSSALSEEKWLDLLQESMKPDEAARVLAVAIEWGRYGELFEYDYHTGLLRLPENDTAA